MDGPTSGSKRPAASQGEGTAVQKPVWTRNEDQMIMDGVRRLGPKWNVIAQSMPGRTSHAVRNRWHRLQRFYAEHQINIQDVVSPMTPVAVGGGDGRAMAHAGLPLGMHEAQMAAPGVMQAAVPGGPQVYVPQPAIDFSSLPNEVDESQPGE
mmetsp:Transcript_4814/g.13966  ORF Transcript_4814/g.13966 Transcript_4814/m.13966 type:complete len:152 (+) Transcript_4814:2511-2966(+)